MKKILILGALLAVSCAKIVEIDTTPTDSIKTIPFSVMVSSDETRATLDANLKTLKYAAGDQLYIESESRPDVKAILTLASEDAGKTKNVTFSGDMQYTGDMPANDLLLKATLVSSRNQGIQIADGKVTGMVYPTHNNCCTDVFEAVEKYSLLTGLGTFGERKFPLYQHTAFLSFAVNLEGVAQDGKEYSVYFMNDGQSYLMGNLSTGSAAEEYRIQFALPVAEGTVLKDASVKLVTAGSYNSDYPNTNNPQPPHPSPATFSASFGGNEPKTLTPKVYRVTKTATKPTYVNTGLPIIEIITNAGVHASTIDGGSKETEYPAWVRIHVGDNIFQPQPNKKPQKNCSIKGRGNTTWKWDKKPYKLKLETETSLSQMGLSTNENVSKHWVLLANFMDKTMMRNRVAMKLSSMMDNLSWTPECVPVELYIDGEHRGNYLLIEQVRVGVGRVVVAPDGATPENANDVGFMMELDFHFDNYYGPNTSINTNKDKIQWRSPYGRSKYASLNFRDGKTNQTTITTPTSGNKTVSMGIPFSIKEPDWDPDDNAIGAEAESQLTYIKNYVNSAAATLFSKGTVNNWWYNVTAPNPDRDNGYPKYLNVESFIDYWIVFELMINHELANPGSVYMTKPVGGKLTAGPCWDFDWGTLSDGYNNNRWPNPAENLMNADAIWYESLMKDYSYVDQLYTRFMELKSQLQTIPAKMDEWEREMAVSAELNFQMWNPARAGKVSNGGNLINGDESSDVSYHEAVSRIKNVYTSRLELVEKKLRLLRNSFPPASNN